MSTVSTTRDYKDFSFNELHELIKVLYKEIDRLAAERKASQDALDRLSNNVNISSYALSQIQDAAKKAVLGALEERAKQRRAPVKKAKRKK